MTSITKKTKIGLSRHETIDGLAETFVLLDNSTGSGAPTLLFEDPIEIITTDQPSGVVAAIQKVEQGVESGLHAAGYLSYEAGYILEPKIAHLIPAKHNMPLVWFGLYKSPREMTHDDVDNWLAEHKKSGSYEFSNVSHAWDRAAYLKRFQEVQKNIRSGDIYQLNLTFKARFELTGSPLTFYADLRQKQRVAYGGIVDTGAVTILSASPELFIEQDGRQITTRPMKGTASRRGIIADDAAQRHELATDVKQRAENLMIVDLMRNDLGRVAKTGSVTVSDLFTVETFKTLHQMTSGVEAELLEGISLSRVLQAIFPPGSITGAPKIRAMELIRELEDEPRGVYCGAIGHVSPSGASLFNVAIRTPVVFRDGTGEMGIGSGVVYDSVGEREYAECLLKMKFLTDPPKIFELIETMLFVPGEGIWLRDEHMARLAASAEYFSYQLDLEKVAVELDAKISQMADKRQRVRTLLSEDGAVSVTTTVIPEPDPEAVMRYIVSPTRLDPDNPFLFHKTTRREMYDREWQHYSQTCGTDDVVYLNKNGALAEGSRTNIFIKRNGVLLTPPLSVGLLPGTLRARLLSSGEAREAELSVEDLTSGEEVYLGNSVRGLVRAERIET
ncbi:MAG: aminodeoxychorismate synthase component I [Hyphomicrobiaceae bacterium]